ncbi:MAG: hypothetical protein PHS14_00475 [Elusimicrobia bacterium]|nr:hypothetical protein [Elusimicrobiota bacterium]
MKLILIAFIASMLVIPARADEKAAPAPAKSGWSDFFKNLKNTLAQSAVGGERKKGRGAQGVAAVRGESQAKKNISDPNEPGIKGDMKSSKAKKELGYDMELEAAIDLLGKGKLEEGLKALEAFKVAHPKHRTGDVDKAIEGAKAMIAEQGAAPAAKE